MTARVMRAASKSCAALVLVAVVWANSEPLAEWVLDLPAAVLVRVVLTMVMARSVWALLRPLFVGRGVMVSAAAPLGQMARLRNSRESSSLLERAARARAVDPTDTDEVARIRDELASRAVAQLQDPAETVEVRAVHEAGHVLAVLAQGGTIESAHIRRIGDSGGRVDYLASVEADSLTAVWQRLCTTVAGTAAERYIGVVTGGGCADYLQAERDAATLLAADYPIPGVDDSDRSVSGLLRAADSHAAAIIAARPRAFVAIRDALEDSGRHFRVLRDPDVRPLFDLDADRARYVDCDGVGM